MEKLFKGLQQFRKEVFEDKKELFKKLSKGQSPEVLFITCSDSRVDPNLLVQAEPGDLFIIRNAGNIVPPHGADHGGVGASIEYAVSVLKVTDIIVCGHSQCGAMGALLNPDSLKNLPQVARWLSHSEATRAIMETSDTNQQETRLEECIEHNVLVQINHLKTLPYVAARLNQGDLQLHGWVYDIETGTVLAYDPTAEGFKQLTPDGATASK